MASGDGSCDRFFNTEACGCDLGDCQLGSLELPGAVGDRVFYCSSGYEPNAFGIVPTRLPQSQVCDGTNDCTLGYDRLDGEKTIDQSQRSLGNAPHVAKVKVDMAGAQPPI